MDDLKAEDVPCEVIPVTEYDPFEAKFAASLYWLVFRATEDGRFDNIPSQVTSPVQRDSEKRITVRPEVTEFLTNGEIYSKVCNSIFGDNVPEVGQWAILQTLSSHGFYVVEEGDLAVTDSALQQKKPFRKSTHLALMDCLMNAFASQAVSVQQVVESVSKFSSFNVSKELPFDLEDALLLWINKISSALNENQLKKQRQHAEQLLQNQDKAKRFRFRRDQLQPKVQTLFPVLDDLLKDISNGQSLLGILVFYYPSAVKIEDIRFGKDLSLKDSVHNLDLFRSACSQFICTSVLALKLEDLLYGSHAMKPNIIALLSEMYQRCEVEVVSENGINGIQNSKSDLNTNDFGANKDNLMDNRSSSPLTSSLKRRIEKSSSEGGSLEDLPKGRTERSWSMSGQLGISNLEKDKRVAIDEDKHSMWWKSQSEKLINSTSRPVYKSPFQLDFTVDSDHQQLQETVLTPRQETKKQGENPFSGIYQKPVLVGESRKTSLPNVLGEGESPRVKPKQESPLLLRRSKQKQRTLDYEEWDMQQDEVEELHLKDAQRSQSLTGLDQAKVEPRQSFHAWQDKNTGSSLSDSNLSSSRSEKISLDFRPSSVKSVPQREVEGVHASTRSTGLRWIQKRHEEHSSEDNLCSSPKTTEALNMKPHGNSPMERKEVFLSGVRDSSRSDISAKELNQFEEIEAMILVGKSVDTPRKFVKSSKPSSAHGSQEEEDELDNSVSSDDMSRFRLEVLQRLTEDKLREIPDGAEMEDDDDPIFLARSNNSANTPSQQCSRLNVNDSGSNAVAVDQLSPITENTEPCSSVASNPNSASSSNSTAPSSPCSPLDVAPFMPEFFTTSPANTLDRQKHRKSPRNSEEADRTLVADVSDAQMCSTPRSDTKSASRTIGHASSSSEQLARGSYTVGHVSEESAKAAGIPVITEMTSVEHREDTPTIALENRGSGSVFREGQFERHVSLDLSTFEDRALSTVTVESKEVPVETVDNRRDSLDCSPLNSPSLIHDQQALALEDHTHATSNAVDGVTTLDSPGDVIIYERLVESSASKHDSEGSVRSSQAVQHSQRTVEPLWQSKRADTFVFDFNQGTVDRYYQASVPEYRTYKKRQQGGETRPGNTQDTTIILKGSEEQKERAPGKDSILDDNAKVLWNKNLGPSSQHGRRGINELDACDASEENREFQGGILDARRSDSYMTYRKGVSATTTDQLLAQFSEPSAKHDKLSTLVKSSAKQGDNNHRVTAETHHISGEFRSQLLAHDVPSSQPLSPDVTTRPLSSRDGDERLISSPREGGKNEKIRVSGSVNIVRSRTFRKKPDGQIIEDEEIPSASPSGLHVQTPSRQTPTALSGQQSVFTPIRGSPEGAGSENSYPNMITWADDARLTRRIHRTSTSPRSRGIAIPKSDRPGAKITWLTAARSGLGGQVILNDKGEIEDSQQQPLQDTVKEEPPAMTSQQAYLLMQLNEKRRLIETEKMRAQKQSEDEHRKLCETVFWYVIHKSQGGQKFEESNGTQAGTRFQGQLQTPEPELSDQPSPPIAWSSPAQSPLPATPAHKSTTPHGQLYDTREFRLSEYPPTNDHNFVRPSSEPVVDVASLEPEAVHPTTSTRKCWDVSPAKSPTPPLFVRPETEDDVKVSHVKPAAGSGTPEVEVEVEMPTRKGLAMFIGDDAQPSTEVMTPEQEKKREKFMRLRQKKLEEERIRKEAELEKKRRKEEKLREKEQQLKLEERLRLEELERQKSEQEWRVREASEAQAPRVPDSYATYRAGPRKPSYGSGDDGNSYFVLGQTQSSGFAEFSGPQCYVKPSGKSNRKIIVNAVSHVCLSGTVNQEQKDKCLQAISESDGHHFMILFKDGLKFRGLYVHNLENDQLHKIFGIGPRLIMGKMVESLYKYNSGGKEFVKIPSKTVSISVDGFTIQKSCWQSSKPTVQSKTSSNLKRPPRPPQR